MMLLNRFLTFLTPALTGFAMLKMIWNPTDFVPWLLILLGVQIFTILKLSQWKLRSRDTWAWLTLVVMFSASMSAWMLILDYDIARYLVLGVTAVILLLFLDHLFDFLFARATYQSYSLEHISRYMMLMTMFVTASAVFAAPLFLNISRLFALGVGALLVFILEMLSVWWLKLESAPTRQLLLTLYLCSVELLWVLFFLPLHFYVNAMLVTFAFYLILNLGHYAATQSLSSAILKRYAGAGFLIFVLILATAEWL